MAIVYIYYRTIHCTIVHAYNALFCCRCYCCCCCCFFFLLSTMFRSLLSRLCRLYYFNWTNLFFYFYVESVLRYETYQLMRDIVMHHDLWWKTFGKEIYAICWKERMITKCLIANIKNNIENATNFKMNAHTLAGCCVLLFLYFVFFNFETMRCRHHAIVI